MEAASTFRTPKKPLAITAPNTISETGISKSLLEQLAIKILGLRGEMSLVDLSRIMGLQHSVIEVIFQSLRREQLCEVKGMELGTYRIIPSSQGKARAMELLALNSYAGAAPISLEQYGARVREQSKAKTVVRAADLVQAFASLVLSADLFIRLGTAMVSSRSMFLYGPPGTGKTSIANCIAGVYADAVWIPHAIEVDSHIITVYDSSVHQQVEVAFAEENDQRWVLCRTPKVLAGGELSPEELDLQYNAVSRYYTAPLQMKANNGVFVVDDFGRQRFAPQVLLNRWMTPLELGYDFLTLSGGKKIEVPFDAFVVFATNLDPADLADEAFLRRIPNKINVDYATPEQFTEIFQMECAARSLPFDRSMAQYLAFYLQHEVKKPLAHCYVRDIINQILWNAAFLGGEVQISQSTIETACKSYFLASAKPTTVHPGELPNNQ
jgi:ATPase family associated with various cellular activities (AAA)